MIMLFISFDGLSYTIPVNPKDIAISQNATNQNIDIIGLGKATRKAEPGLRTIQIKSFFPNPKSRYYMNVNAATYIEFIEKIWNTENINNKVAEISSYGIKDDIAGKEINMPFVIEKFEYRYQAGDFDTEYTLSIKEYKPYGVKVIEDFTEGMQSGRTPSTVKDNIPGLMQDTQPTVEAKTYTVKSGDTLWSIAKRCTGNGNNWQALYNMNKDIIGANPNSLRVGTILTLPENWNSPSASVNTNTSGNLKVSTYNKTSKLNNSTASNNIGVATALAVGSTKIEDTSLGSEAWANNNQRLMELYYFERQNSEHIAELNKLANKFKELDKYGTTSKDQQAINQDIKELQDIYNKAAKYAADESKTPEQRIEKIKTMRAAELALYNRNIGTRQQRLVEVEKNPTQNYYWRW